MEHTISRLHQSQTKAKEASWIVCKWCQSMIGPIGNEVLWPQKNLKQDIRKGCSATDQKKGPILCPTAKTKNLCIDRNLESQRVSGFPPTKKGCRIAYRGVTSIHEGFRAFIMHFFSSCLRLAGNWWLIKQCNKHNKHFCSLHSWCMFQAWSPILVRISSFIQKERPFVAHDGISIYGGKWKTCATGPGFQFHL